MESGQKMVTSSKSKSLGAIKMERRLGNEVNKEEEKDDDFIGSKS